jgi:serine/threonine protein kinase
VPRYGPNPAAAGIDTSIPPEDRYDILGRIAAGGMAEIYLSRMSMGGGERECVLKRLMPELQNDHEFVQMFYDEANIASQLVHPNIVQIFELGELDGSLFIAMELLRGVNLRDLLARLHARGEVLPIPLAIRICCNALAGLEYAHNFADKHGRRLNVVHRDVSPQNIIVTYDGVAKLVDFGVAKAEGRLHQTRAGLIKGKFAYMSPEQVSGGAVDGRSDMFALAEVFYELLLQRHPFYAQSDMEVLRAILDKDPPHPCSLDGNFPPQLGEIFVKAMKKAPGDRYQSAAAMQDAMEGYLQESRTPASTSMLARFVKELFADRIEAERVARENRDDDALIDALTVGHAEIAPPPEQQQPKKRRSSNVQLIERDFIPNEDSGYRERVVEISRAPVPGDDPAERGAPAFIAHSGVHHTPEGVRKRFQSQVRNLFNEEEQTYDEPAGDDPTALPSGLIPMEDSAELPTMLGALSREQLEEIRGSAARAAQTRKKQKGEVVVGPAIDSKAPSVRRSEKGRTPAVQKQNVTHRSQTVLAPDAPVRPRNDKIGLVFFVAGLIALIIAVAYAGWLYTSSKSPTMSLVVRSTPSGAQISLNGVIMGNSPQMFEGVPSDQEHVIVMELPGYEPCTRRVAPTDVGQLAIDCDLAAK